MNSPAPKGLRAAWPPEPEGHGSIGPRWDAAGSSTTASTKEPPRLGLTTALHAEWTKLRTLAGTYWLLAAAVALTVTVGAAVAAATRCPAGPACPVDTTKLSLTGIQLGQAVMAILATAVICGEYSTGMIRVTVSATPRRSAVLAAKATVLTVLVLPAGTIAVAGSVLAGRLILPGHGFTADRGYPPLSPADGPLLRAAAGSVLYLALIALLSLGVATIIRDSAAAIRTVLGLLAVPSAGHRSSTGQQPSGATGDRALGADERRAHHPRHHQPARPAHKPMGRPPRSRHLGCSCAPRPRADVPAARRVRTCENGGERQDQILARKRPSST